MPFIDVRNLPQITSIQAALDAILNRANVTVANWQTQLTQKIAEFYATPTVLERFNVRLAFVKAKATAHGTLDAFRPLNTATAGVINLGVQYEKAKPVVSSALAQVNTGTSGGSIPLSSGALSAVATAGVRMAGVFSAIKAQDVAITAIERNVLTPAEAAQLYAQLQKPNATRNTLLTIGAVALVWMILRRR